VVISNLKIGTSYFFTPLSEICERKYTLPYILVSHSMGGVASREYVQGMGYNFDVDKVVTLDSPHEGTGALNMQLGLQLFCSKMRRKSFKENRV
jgi:triacylglycerol esterase/lipase EstA (alpha/beta hydrolase family)